MGFCRFLGGGEGGRLVKAWDAKGTPAVDFAAAEVEAVGADCLLPAAYDASESVASLSFGFSAHTAQVSGFLEAGEERAGLIGEPFSTGR